MIDIVLATYNGESFIREQILSIKKSFKYSELVNKVIIVDDGSTDNTLSIIEELKDEKFKLFSNNGVSLGPKNNFVSGLNHCEADYIMFCDQDDVWDVSKLVLLYERMLALKISNDDKTPKLVFSDLKVVDEHLTVISNSFFNHQKLNPQENNSFTSLLLQNVAPGCSMMFNRSLMDLALPIPKEALMHDWWLILVAKAFGVVSVIDKPLVLYRQHGRNQVGAKVKNIRSFTSNFDGHVKSVCSASAQSKAFMDYYIKSESKYKKLSQKSISDLKYISNLSSTTVLGRLLKFIIGTLRKQGFQRNFGFVIILIALSFPSFKNH